MRETKKCKPVRITDSGGKFLFCVRSSCTKKLPDISVTDSDGSVRKVKAQTDVMCSPGGGGGFARVQNGAIAPTYTETVASGSTLILPQETYNVYVNGSLNTTFTELAMQDLIININV